MIVPKMGGILFSPPAKGTQSYQLSAGPDSLRLSFNSFMNYNDGLLANHLVKQENITYTEALEEIEKFVNEFYKQLNAGNSFTIERVGILYTDAGKNIRIRPEGTPGVLDEKINHSKSDVAQLPENEKIHFAGIQNEFSISPASSILDQREPVAFRRKRFIKLFFSITGSMILLCLFIYLMKSGESAPGANTSNKIDKKIQTVDKKENASANESVTLTNFGAENKIAPVTMVEPAISNLSGPSTATDQPGTINAGYKYLIVVGTFNSIENSTRKLEELKIQGFRNAQILSIKGRPHLVCIDHYGSVEEAQQGLNQLKQQFKGAWIFRN